MQAAAQTNSCSFLNKTVKAALKKKKQLNKTSYPPNYVKRSYMKP